MKKYLTASKCEWQRLNAYRFTIFSYRIGNFIEILIQVIIWTIIFKETNIVYGYTYSEMISYILIGYLFGFLTTNYDLDSSISRSIQNGEVSNILCKPINWIYYTMATAFGRLYVTFFYSLVMQLAIIAMFYKSIIIPESLTVAIIIIPLLVVGYFIRLFIAIIIGLVAFWSTYVSGIQFSARVFMRFFTGSYFSLTLLPPEILKLALAMPFAYTFYVPAQIYLGKISLSEGLTGLAVSIAWLIALFFLVKFVFKLAMKKNESVGI